MNYRFFKIFSFLGVSFLKTENLKQFVEIEKNVKDLLFDLGIEKGVQYRNIKSQINQDLFVLKTLNWKRDGYFVEFGATNGIDLSNTYLLEKDFGWSGILSEPNPQWSKALIKNRKCHKNFDCIWKYRNKVYNFEISNIPEHSGLYFKKQNIINFRKKNLSKVKTITLTDLLEKYNAPKNIDYLSIDTEGSEFEILSTFNFAKYNISIITCEHNYSSKRNKIFNLLKSNGYKRVFEGFSRWDDWYVKE